MTGDLQRFYGCADFNAVFTSERRVAPWPAASRQRNTPLVTDAEISALLSGPPAVCEIDPRTLHASQTWVLASHTAYYLSGVWERTGTTSADRDRAHNRYPWST